MCHQERDYLMYKKHHLAVSAPPCLWFLKTSNPSLQWPQSTLLSNLSNPPGCQSWGNGKCFAFSNKYPPVGMVDRVNSPQYGQFTWEKGDKPSTETSNRWNAVWSEPSRHQLVPERWGFNGLDSLTPRKKRDWTTGVLSPIFAISPRWKIGRRVDFSSKITAFHCESQLLDF